jgi:RNA polymerase sigma factor (sigma-70 family)
MNLEVSLPISGSALLRPSPQSEAVANADSARLADLTSAIRRGDEAAFTRFYELYNLRLYKYLLVLAKGDELEAREVLQIVVLKFATKMEVFDEERRLWGWMCRLGRNAFVDRYRSHRRDGRHVVPLAESGQQPSGEAAADNLLAHSLDAALASFTAEEAELLRAAYIDDRPLQELANEAGQTYKALESRLGRLRKKLKESMLNHLRHEQEL